MKLPVNPSWFSSIFFRTAGSGGTLSGGPPSRKREFRAEGGSGTDLVWTTASVRQRPTYTSVTNYTATGVTEQTHMNLLPLNVFDGPALAVLNTNGLLMERIPVGHSAGWITRIFPLSDGHTERLAGTSPTCFTEATLLSGTWEGLVVLSIKDIGVPTLEAMSGNPGSIMSLFQDALRIFRDVYGKNAIEKALVSPTTVKVFLARPENRSKKSLLVRALRKVMLHPPSASSASIKSSGVHSYCEVQNPIFASPLQFADQDWWTIISNGTTP